MSPRMVAISGLFQKLIGHTMERMIVNHYYRQVPTPDDEYRLVEA